MRSSNPSGWRHQSITATEDRRALPSCGVKQKPISSLPFRTAGVFDWDYRPAENAGEVAMVTTKREQDVCRPLKGYRDRGIGLEPLPGPQA